jgi:integrase
MVADIIPLPRTKGAKSTRSNNVTGTPAQIDKLFEPGKYYVTKSRMIPNPPAGFYVRVSRTGIKSFYVRLAVRDPKSGIVRRKTDVVLGRYPTVTLSDAASAAADAVKSASLGLDPTEGKRQIRAKASGTPTLHEGLDTFEQWSAREGRRTASDIHKSILRLVPTRLHNQKIGLITRDDVVPRLKEKDLSGSPTVARNTASHISSFLKFVHDKTEWAVGDWLEGYQRPAPARKRDHVPSIKEMREIVSACRENLPGTWGNLIEFLALTGVRVGEGRQMLWSEVNDDFLWDIPSDRMKNKQRHAVPLSPAAMTVLNRQQNWLGGIGKSTSAFVFTTTGEVPVVKLQTKIYSKVMPNGTTPHDFRRSLATHAAEAGFDSDLVERLLSHTRPGVAGVYNRSERLDAKREALEWWGSQLG